MNKLYDGTFLYSYGQEQHQGKRQYQEDFFGFYEPPLENEIERLGILFVLTDGMGGVSKGETASVMAVKRMIKYYPMLYKGSVPEALEHAIVKTNDDIFQKGFEDKKYWKMGTTCAVVVLKKGELFYASVGDSLIFLLRGSELRQLNEDHSVGAAMDKKAASGEISVEEAKSHPGRTKLYSYLGDKTIKKIDVSTNSLEIKKGDKILICSDGLYGFMEREQIVDNVMKNTSQEATEKLIRETMSLDYEDQDNISIQIIEALRKAKKSDLKALRKEKASKRKSKKEKKNKISSHQVLLYLSVIVGIMLLSFAGGYYFQKATAKKAEKINNELLSIYLKYIKEDPSVEESVKSFRKNHPKAFPELIEKSLLFDEKSKEKIKTIFEKYKKKPDDLKEKGALQKQIKTGSEGESGKARKKDIR